MADRPLSEVLHQAIATGDLDTVQALLQQGVNANSTLTARCPIDRYSLSIDVKKPQNGESRDRYSLGMDRFSFNNGSFTKSYGKETKHENNNFIDYDCRGSIKETPILESDYEDDENEDFLKKSVDEDNAVNDLIKKCNDKNNAIRSLNDIKVGKNDIIEYNEEKGSKFYGKQNGVINHYKDDVTKGKDEEKVNNKIETPKERVQKYFDEDEALRELLEKCSEDEVDVSKVVVKCVDKEEVIEKVAEDVSHDVISDEKEVGEAELGETDITSDESDVEEVVAVESVGTQLKKEIKPVDLDLEREDSDINSDFEDSEGPLTPIVYCEDLDRTISPLIPLKPLAEEQPLLREKPNLPVVEKLNDNNRILVERSPSLKLKDRPESEELLIEEKPLKLVPRLRKKLSNRWAKKDVPVREKIVVNKKRLSAINVDNEQLNENYEGLAFFEAVREGMDMTVRTLLETSNNNQLNMPDENGFSPLMQAAWHGQQECLRVLLDHGANVSLRNNTGCTATHFAAAQGNLECLDVLINYGHVDVNSQTKFSATPLILAAKGGHADCVTLLLESGADVNMQYRGNQNPLLFAAGNGHFECMEILIENGVHLDQANSQGVSPLMRAIQQGHNACAKLLIEREVDIDLQDVIGRSPIHFAIEYDNPEGLKMLIDAGADVEVQTRGESTPLDYLERFPSVQCENILNAHNNAVEVKEVQESVCENQKIKTKKNRASCTSCISFRKKHSKSNKEITYS